MLASIMDRHVLGSSSGGRKHVCTNLGILEARQHYVAKSRSSLRPLDFSGTNTFTNESRVA